MYRFCPVRLTFVTGKDFLDLFWGELMPFDMDDIVIVPFEPRK